MRRTQWLLISFFSSVLPCCSAADILLNSFQHEMDVPSVPQLVGGIPRIRNLGTGYQYDYVQDSNQGSADYQHDSGHSSGSKSSKKGSKKTSKKGSSRSSSRSSSGASSSTMEPVKNARNYMDEGEPQFDAGELSFVMMMDEMGYSQTPKKIGTVFAFSATLSTNDFLVGSASGSCTVASSKDSDFGICNFYLKFNTGGKNGYGTVALNGNIDNVGGYMRVTGTGGDLAYMNDGTGIVNFDPAGNSIVYVMIELR